MKAKLFLTMVAVAAALPASAQVLHDPTRPGSQGPAEASRNKEGKLATRDQQGTFKLKDGIVRAQGAMHFLKDGKLNKVTHEMKLSEGFVVRPDGQVTKPDGSNVTLQEGQMLTLDGRLEQAPASTGTTARGTHDKPLERTGNLSDFGQSGMTGPGGSVRKEQQK